MTINGRPVTVDEFKYIYEKNNGSEATYSKESIDDYLDLFTKFKMKVHSAKDLRLDTLPELREELMGYKMQLANSYLNDRELMENLTRELYQRIKTDVHVKHILIMVDPNADATAITAAEKKCQDILKQIKSGQSFEAMAKAHSEDTGTASAGGDLGFFTAMMPSGFYNFESAMYDTPVGNVAGPVRTKLGFHLLKVIETRPARGEVEVSHILVRKKDNTDAKSEIEKVHQGLKNGVPFENLVNLYSEDKESVNNQGKLPAFGINTYETDFENAAFALQKVGDFSQPIETSIGFHILKLNRKVPMDEYGTFRKKYEFRIKKDERFEVANTRMIEKIKREGNFKFEQSTYDQFAKGLDDEFLSFKWTPEANLGQGKTLFAFGNATAYTLADFINYCKKNTKTRLKFDKGTKAPQEVSQMLLTEFVNQKTIEFEQANLEQKYMDFKALMREYEEGILLFEVTKMMVWDKANQDSIGLQKFYDDNKNKYMANPKALVTTYSVGDNQKTADKIYKFAIKNNHAKLIEKHNKKKTVIQHTDTIVDQSQLSPLRLQPQVNSITALSLDTNSNQYQFSRVSDIIPAQPKSLKEARGYVVADYQEFLEKQWLVDLNNTYKIEINQEVLNGLSK